LIRFISVQRGELDESTYLFSSIYLKTSRKISMADMKVKLTIYGLISESKYEVDATFNTECSRFYSESRVNINDYFHYNIDVEVN
jgi:hypothetical protein